MKTKPIIHLELNWEQELTRQFKQSPYREVFRKLNELSLQKRIKEINKLIASGEAVYK